MIKDNEVPLFNKIRYALFIPFILLIGVITSPLTLLFKWNGFYILCISIYYWCSLTEAKRLFLENKDGKYTIMYSSGAQSDLATIPDFDTEKFPSMLPDDYDYMRDSPSYSHHPSNIHYTSSDK